MTNFEHWVKGCEYKGEQTMDHRYSYGDLRGNQIKRRQLFEAMKDKAAKCADRTQLCAVIYPLILHLVRECADAQYTRCATNSFEEEIYDLRRALSLCVSSIPSVVSPVATPLDLERIRDEALDAAIEMAINIATLEVHQCSINLSAIMAHFVEDL